MNQKSIYAIAVSEKQAVQIEESLTKAGFSNDEISALIPGNDSIHEFPQDSHRNGHDGVTVGAGNGGVLGEALDLISVNVETAEQVQKAKEVLETANAEDLAIT